MAENQGITMMDLEKKGGIGKVDHTIEEREKLRIKNFEKFISDQDWLSKYLESLHNFGINNGGIGLQINGNFDVGAMAQTFYLLQSDMTETIKKLKEKNKELRRKIEELESFKTQFGYDEQYKKWKNTQRTGRTPKKIDWERYDHMVSAGLPQKDILKYLNISGNTLRKKLKERETQKGR